MNVVQTKTSPRMLLKDPFSDSDANRVISRYWHAWDYIDATDTNPFEVIWGDPKKNIFVHYFDDQFVDARYMLVRGDDLERATRLVQESCPVLSVADLKSEVSRAGSDEEAARAITRLGVGMGTFEGEGAQMFERALASPSPRVRRAALLGMAYASWPEFEPLLTSFIQGEAEEKLRAQAGRLLEGIRAGLR